MSVPGFNWYMLENDIGTIATVLQNNAIEHTTQVLYYLDDNSKSNGAMRNDTGDSLAYGDSGVQINVSNGYSIEISDEDLTATFFYLNSLHSSSFGDTLMGYVMHPLKITVIPRRNDVIPVELATFTAVQEKNVVVLSWTTATESNNYGFQIQRKNNGNPNWSTIGFIQGSGTSTKMNRYAYSDERIVLGVNFYRLGQIDSDGKINYSQEVMLNLQKPQQLDLAQNYPNPFNPNTELTFQIPQSSKVTLVIYNLLGQKIRTLLDKEMMAGYHSIQWDGYGDRGEQVGSGAYIYRLQVANEVRVRKMIKMQ